MLYLNPEFEKLWQSEDPYEVLQTMEGEVYRQLDGRKTFLFTMEGKSYFAKLHHGIGWREIFKNLLQLRLPIYSARNEWRAISSLQKLGIETMTCVAYGERGLNPAARQSFIVTEALQETISLEDFCKDWPNNKPDFRLKLQLIRKLAEITRGLHRNGICHRDYYLCHFLMHTENGSNADSPKLSLIDLHRALIKRNLRQRWIVKDLAQLYYSAMHIGLSQRDLLRFICLYEGVGLNDILTNKKQFWDAVTKRAFAMANKLGPAI